MAVEVDVAGFHGIHYGDLTKPRLIYFLEPTPERQLWSFSVTIWCETKPVYIYHTQRSVNYALFIEEKMAVFFNINILLKSFSCQE